jgi:hypothetical protein
MRFPLIVEGRLLGLPLPSLAFLDGYVIRRPPVISMTAPVM